MPWEETARDPALLDKRTSLVKQAATLLDQNRMISFDRIALTFVITDLGRIAAKYYIRHKSIELFNQMTRPKMTEADVLAMLSKSTEVRFYSS
jgi:antiviral helicase SLH1